MKTVHEILLWHRERKRTLFDNVEFGTAGVWEGWFGGCNYSFDWIMLARSIRESNG